MISRTKNRPLPNLGDKPRVYLPRRQSQELKPFSADVQRCTPSIIQPHLQIIHLSRASMLSTRVHGVTHAQIWQPNGHWERYRKPTDENHSSYHNSGLPSIQKLMFGSRDSPARALFRQGLGLQRLGLPEKCSRTRTSPSRRIVVLLRFTYESLGRAIHCIRDAADLLG